tara:strand:+ start:81 stop:632 length:552 start_codon:yes stop_codon:yes gene_type:complete
MFKNFFLFLFHCLLISSFGYGQSEPDTSKAELLRIAPYPCVDNVGKPFETGTGNIGNYFQFDEIKKFKKGTPIQFYISKIRIGNDTLNINFSYTGKIKTDTEILDLTKGYGVKFSIAKAEEGGVKKYLYKLSFYEKDECWRQINLIYGFLEVLQLNTNLKYRTFGTKGFKNYMVIIDGGFKIN